MLLEYGASTSAADRNGLTAEGLAAGWLWDDARVLNVFAEFRKKRLGGDL